MKQEPVTHLGSVKIYGIDFSNQNDYYASHWHSFYFI